MTYEPHAPNCASRSLLLKDPPTQRPCDCPVSQRLPAYPESLAGGPVVDACSTLTRPTGQVLLFPGQGSVEIAGGSPTATTTVPAPTLADQLRELARQLEAGEIGDLKQLICVPVDGMGTDYPHLLGPRMTNAELIGRLEICKATVLDSLWVDIE